MAVLPLSNTVNAEAVVGPPIGEKAVEFSSSDTVLPSKNVTKGEKCEIGYPCPEGQVCEKCKCVTEEERAYTSAETLDANTSTELFQDYSECPIDDTATYGVQNYVNAITFGDYATEGVIAVTTVWYNPATKTIGSKVTMYGYSVSLFLRSDFGLSYLTLISKQISRIGDGV